ncbi:YcxB family protein [Streptomyces vilmorinianum]|uniref:YcxB family protein n=1 Tax=Streptomyces vilmorinianum TaxID=3051092 RepID=UPI0010FBA243|nr:YcxB family protein [Streptomyces vilmorinianum]
MTAEQSAEQSATTRETVELTYLPVVSDATEALRARMRATPAGRLQNAVLIGAGGLMSLALVLTLTGPKGPSLGGAGICLLGLVLIACMYAMIPSLQGRQVHRMFAPQGEFRGFVDGSGVRVVSRESDTTYRWTMLTRYAETRDLFVLLTPDKYGIGLAVLPKRGVAHPAEVDRLRAVLDRYSTRV